MEIVEDPAQRIRAARSDRAAKSIAALAMRSAEPITEDIMVNHAEITEIIR